MSTEVWFRNPQAYVKELVECGEYLIAWDRGLLVKKKIDLIKHAQLYYGQTYPWRLLAVGPQGTAEYRNGDEWDKPSAVYPTWVYGENVGILEDMIDNHAGSDLSACNDRSVEGNERPVFGQEHRVVITELPPAATGPARKFLRLLKELQEDNPECIIHLHGLYSYRIAFGMGFKSADMDPRAAAAKGKVHLPVGNEIRYEETVKHIKWVKQMGFKPAELSVPRNRCMFNIKSAKWAGLNYDELFAFRLNGSQRSPDVVTPDADYKPETTKSPFSNARAKALEGDKIQCNVCSLQLTCKFFRQGAVCSLPDAEPTQLAAFFKTRDSDTIIDGLGTLLAAGTRRLETGMRYEEIDGELDPEVTKMLNQIFGQGVTLAKLVNPNLRGGTKVNIGIGSGGSANVQIANSNPKVFIAGVIRELEQQGISRENITPKMLEGALAAMGKGADQQEAIEGTVVSSETRTA